MSTERAEGGEGLSAEPEPGWWVFRGTGVPPHADVPALRWPDPPPWRAFDGGPPAPAPPDDGPEFARRLGTTPSRLLDRGQIAVVNAGIHLRRPLLVTGRPGVGKSSLAYLISRELRLGRVLRWPVTSRTTVRAGLYEYDAIGRAQATAQIQSAASVRWPGAPWKRADDGGEAERGGRAWQAASPPIGDFVQLGPLGTALLARDRPRVLLIDELDKSDFDLPNDLLTIFEDAEFTIPELARLRNQSAEITVHTDDPGNAATVRDGVVRCREFPIIVITSNGEREFSPAFLRRCTRLDLREPDQDQLGALVAAHFPASAQGYRDLIERFEERRSEVGGLAADQLLSAAHLLATGAADDGDQAWSGLLEVVWRQLAPTRPDFR